jgi:hypothetical protein
VLFVFVWGMMIVRADSKLVLVVVLCVLVESISLGKDNC